MLDRLTRDLRYGVRSLRKTPGFAAVVILTLGLGIGLTTAMFSVVNGLLLEPLPYPDAERLVMLWQGRRGQDVDEDWFSIAQWVDIKEGTTTFDEVALAVGFGATLTERGAPTQVGFVRVTSNYMDLIGAHPALGRVLDDGDDVAGTEPVAVISHQLWATAFGGDPQVVGQTVTLNGTSTRIVGVLARDVLLDNEVLPTLGAVNPLAVVISLPLTPELLAQRGREDYNIVARLKPGATRAQAQAELDVVASRIQELHETDPSTGFFIRALSLLDEVVGGVRTTLWLLLGAVSILLLIACGNVANLLLSRASARERELAIRAAVGASRRQLVRQLLTEGAILALLGGGLGLAVAAGSLEGLRAIGAASLPRLYAVGLDGRVLAFAIVATALTCVLFALLPAFRAADVDLMQFVRSGGRGGIGRGSLWSRVNLSSVLIAGEIALALVLLVGGGLLGRSMLAILQVDPGFAAGQRLTFTLQLAGPAYPRDVRRSFMRDLVRRLEALPGVERAAGVNFLPFGGTLGWSQVRVPGYVPPAGTEGEFIASIRSVTPGYFETMAIPLRNGRTFAEDYPDDAPLTVIIDEQIAAKYYAGRDPIGQRIALFGRDSARVAGVVGAIKHTGLDDVGRPTVYLSYHQFPSSTMSMVLGAAGNVETLAQPAVAAVHALDPAVAVVDVATMAERIRRSLASRRFSLLLMELMSGAALALSVIGIFGLVSYRVSRSTAELGVRMALGAQRTAILRLVLAHGLALALIGAGVGILGALALSRVMRSLLFGVGAYDPVTYATMLLGCVVVTGAACLVPALAATRVDPMVALRAE